MNLHITLYGALREADPSGALDLVAPDGCNVGQLREQLVAFLAEHAPEVSAGVVRRSAFATADTILHDYEPVPADGELAILPPVSGG